VGCETGKSSGCLSGRRSGQPEEFGFRVLVLNIACKERVRGVDKDDEVQDNFPLLSSRV